ncbi:Type II secretion system protein K [Sinobacterium norvegicum]|uniref:Type II secretion system protein K n=1 Tax=Sinobacterium norvegicum TaxID=1641715 RepID=A0ABN8EJ67_9GAMM|nr:type II secretion system minor pseudopilin GspK [Sinobacterium norvegicum]CAH0992496.1 Type II secretion system protein K [Sinobacterium norvegicum]
MHYSKLSDQRGVAMIMAILVVALISALVTAAAREFVLGMKQYANQFNHEQGYYYLLTAETLAKELLQEENKTYPDYDQQDIFVEQVYPLEDVEGWVSGKVIDAQGMINLNFLTSEGGGNSGGNGSENSDDGEQSEDAGGAGSGINNGHTAEQKLLSLVLQQLALDPVSADSLVDAISDWVDSDNIQRNFSGGEDDTYLAKDPAYLAANQPIQSVSELLWIEGMNKDIYRALLPYVSVWGEDKRININSAPALVMKYIAEPELSDSEVDNLIAARPYSEVEMFTSMPELSDKKLGVEVSVMSNRFVLAAEVEVFGSRQTLSSALERHNDKVVVLARSSGRL